MLGTGQFSGRHWKFCRITAYDTSLCNTNQAFLYQKSSCFFDLTGYYSFVGYTLISFRLDTSFDLEDLIMGGTLAVCGGGD